MYTSDTSDTSLWILCFQPRFVFCAACDGGGRWRNWNFSICRNRYAGKWLEMTISGMTMNENNYENLLLTGDSVCRENGVVEFWEGSERKRGCDASRLDSEAVHMRIRHRIWHSSVRFATFGKATLRLKGPMLILSWPTRVINLVQTDSKRFLSTPMCSYNVSGQNVSQDDSI